jgi:hypothetical protein
MGNAQNKTKRRKALMCYQPIQLYAIFYIFGQFELKRR